MSYRRVRVFRPAVESLQGRFLPSFTGPGELQTNIRLYAF
jgi:hypothetical protein